MLETLRVDGKACRQFLLLVHLYSRTDVSALALLRRKLLRPKFTAAQVGKGLWRAGEGHAVATWMRRKIFAGNIMLRNLWMGSSVESAASLNQTLVITLVISCSQVTVGVGMGVTAVSAIAVAASNDSIASAVSGQLEALGNRLAGNVPLLASHPRMIASASVALAAGGMLYYSRCALTITFLLL